MPPSQATGRGTPERREPVHGVRRPLHPASIRSLASSQPVLIRPGGPALGRRRFARSAGEPARSGPRISHVLVVGAARASLLHRRPEWLTACPTARRAVSRSRHGGHAQLVHDVIRLEGGDPDESRRPGRAARRRQPLLRRGADQDAHRRRGHPYRRTGRPLGDRSHPPRAGHDPRDVDGSARGTTGHAQRAANATQFSGHRSLAVCSGTTPLEHSHRLVPQPRPTDAPEAARDRELIFRSERPSLEVSIEYVFKHALLRDVTYETVLLRDRKRLHRLVADWLAANAGDRLGELLEVIAEHRSLSGDVEAAAELFHTAAGRALSAGRSAGAKRLARRALDLWSSATAEAPPEAAVALADACCRLGEFDEADVRGHAGADVAAVTLVRSRGALHRQLDRIRAGRPRARAAQLLDRALPLAESVGGTVLIHVLTGLSWLESGAGDLDEAERYARLARSLAEEVGDLTEAGRCLNTLGAVMSVRGDVDGAARCAERTARARAVDRRSRERGDRSWAISACALTSRVTPRVKSRGMTKRPSTIEPSWR